MVVYIVTGVRWYQRTAESSRVAARRAAAEFRKQDGGAQIERHAYADLDDYVERRRTGRLLADLDVPQRLAARLTRRYGRPETSGGEIAYWYVSEETRD